MKTINRYNDITENDIKAFNERVIIYNATQSSNLECENAILVLENEKIFYEAKKGFFKRLKASDKISAYSQERKYNLFYKFILNFLKENEASNKGINYIYNKGLLNDLKEVSISLYNEEI